MREPSEHEAAIFDALVEVARPVILSRFTADSCIASTRIGLDVLDYFGIRCREIPVLLVVFNAEATALVAGGMDLEQVGAETRKHSADSPGGPWTLGIGAPTGRVDGWAGHLLIGHTETGVVLDLSADQGSRPHKNITLAPYWTRITDEAWWTDPSESAAHRTEDGLYLVFDRRAPNPTGYLTADNWKRRSKGSTQQGLFKDLTGQIIRQVRARVG